MKKSVLRIFYNISGMNWVELSQLEPNKIINFHKIDISNLYTYDDKIIKGEFINLSIANIFISNKKYHIKLFNKIIGIKEVKTMFNNKINNENISLINSICNSFRLQKREIFLNNLFASDNKDIGHAMQEINEYIFCNHFSLWLYNDITNYFTLVSSSFNIEQTFKIPKNVFSENNYNYESFNYEGNNDVLKDMKSLNRIKVRINSLNNLENSNFLIANFYSTHDNYSLREDTIQLIQEIINLKFSKEHFPKVVELERILTNLSEEFQVKKIDDYLNNCVITITKDLGWEAASIFIFDFENGLKLRALKHFGNYKLLNSIIYKKGDRSMTYQIFENNDPKYSYNIDDDSRNTHTFDEVTNHNPKNWIGIPIIIAPNSTPIGVLRVKNKINTSGKIIHFDQLDINILKDISKNIAYLYNLDKDIIEKEENKEKQLVEQQLKYKELTDFVRTYRHEIKTPLTLISTTPIRLIDSICDEYKIKEEALPKTIKQILDDLAAVTARLRYVANSLSFDIDELVRNIKMLFPFKDIVIPIISFSKIHAEKKNRFINIDKDSFLRLPPVIGDANSSQMAFHTIIDNAIKYTKKDGTIYVYGEEDRDWCKLIVSSYSNVTIQQEDKDKIFTQFYRTQEVESKKYPGSGIGLYLAKGIMDINRGKILLTNLNNPTKFELHFKKYGSLQ